MDASDSGPSGDALEVFAEWVTQRQEGRGVEFEELLRQHPALREKLLGQEAFWTRMVGDGSTLREQIERKHGRGSMPEVSLPGPEPEVSQAERASDLISRISKPGARYARYRIDSEVGHGAMGSVLRIWDTELRRFLAMKVILGRADATADGDTPPVSSSKVSRFLEEAQITGQLDHPGIVPVHELGLDREGKVYFTMKLVRGENLRVVFEHVRAGRHDWTQARALQVLLRVCEAMAYAHDKGVIHRDLKPANVMVGKFGEVHVMDWGLARVAGHPDRRDIRPSDASAVLDAGHDPDAPLLTMDGDVLGTPNYMPPEQAAGRLDEIGAHSDVYALGAMLYQLLAGHAPYLEGGSKLSSQRVLERVRAGPPAPIGALAPEVPVELAAICDRAMSREWRKRYADMSELAADLSAFLDGRVVRAYETGAWAEARKWVRRNQGLAAALFAGILILVAGVVVSSILGRRANEQAAVALQEKQDVLKLRAFRTLADLQRRADELWPAGVERRTEYQRWIEDARRLTAQLPDLRATLAEIETRALPQTAEEREQERATHPKLATLENLRTASLSFERMLRRAPWPKQEEVEAQLATEGLPKDAQGLMDAASRLMDSPGPVPGTEVRALVLSQRALELASPDQRVRAHANLAQAYGDLGRFDEALLELGRADEVVTPELRPRLNAFRKGLLGFVAIWRDASGQVQPAQLQSADKLLLAIRELEAEIARRRAWRFPESSDGEASGDDYWHEQLQTLIQDLEHFGGPQAGLIDGLSPEHGLGVARRLELATVVERARSGEAEGRAWSEAIAAIAKSPAYLGVEWPGGAGLVPQRGLIPLGPDPASGLWEFADVQTGVAPARDADGVLILTPETALVFVLLPGGSFWRGAQRKDPKGHNYDPDAQDDEGPVNRVKLSPFLLSKFEMTQGQWLRVAGNNPSQYAAGLVLYDKTIDLRHPVERVSWFDCLECCRRLGFALPSEAEWEYACRGGTDTPWWTGRDLASLNGKVNLADQAAKRRKTKWVDAAFWPELEDGWVIHAPVGTFPANGFGLHEMAGNVWELLGGEMEVYDTPNQVDPVQPRKGDGRDIAQRGGSFRGSAEDTALRDARSHPRGEPGSTDRPAPET
ncbi:MAG: SUMF1/EgtB/PvdO family nonheme iron enzyme [Planctomycetes bacterium]|nr:SUMF1/EgtB/PvdO family nonheme iron enzyme [Planctomycetota bacterium]